MQVNIHNYEEFAIDYLEGNLSAEMEEKMQLFLLQNPEIEAEMMGLEEDMDRVLLEANEAIVFADKAALLQLEEERKVVPLFGGTNTVVHNSWKKSILPIAAALCVFLIWQAFFQPMGALENVGEGIVNVRGEEGKNENLLEENKDELDYVIQELEEKNTAQVATIEGEKNEMEFDLKNNLENKVKGASSNFSQDGQVELVGEQVSPNFTSVGEPLLNERDLSVQVSPNFASVGEPLLNERDLSVQVSPNFTSVGEPSLNERDLSVQVSPNFTSVGEPLLNERDFGDTYQVHQQLSGQVLSNSTSVDKPFGEAIANLENRSSISTLNALPAEVSRITAQGGIAMQVEITALEQSPLPAISYKKQPSNFMRNLRKAFTPQVLAENNADWMNENEGSDILVSISLKPEQHNFIRKIFKNNK